MDDLGGSLASMNFVQLLLLFAFVTSYMLALGGLLGAPARRRAALLALALAVGFAAQTDPWVHGALLMAFVVAGLGLFVLLTWVLGRLLAPREQPDQRTAPSARPAPVEPARTEFAETQAPELAPDARASH